MIGMAADLIRNAAGDLQAGLGMVIFGEAIWFIIAGIPLRQTTADNAAAAATTHV